MRGQTIWGLVVTKTKGKGIMRLVLVGQGSWQRDEGGERIRGLGLSLGLWGEEDGGDDKGWGGWVLVPVCGPSPEYGMERLKGRRDLRGLREFTLTLRAQVRLDTCCWRCEFSGSQGWPWHKGPSSALIRRTEGAGQLSQVPTAPRCSSHCGMLCRHWDVVPKQEMICVRKLSVEKLQKK